MKREGYIHGAVRASPRALKRSSDGSPAAAAKSTSETKFTGKCRRPRCSSCHLHPATKAKSKVKGSHKVHAGDVALNHRLVSWRAGDGGIAPDVYEGASATEVVKYLDGSVHSSFHESSYSTAAAASDGNGGPDVQETVPAGDVDPVVGEADVQETLSMGEIEAEADVQETMSMGEIEAEAVEMDGDGEEELGFCMIGVPVELPADGDDWVVVEEM